MSKISRILQRLLIYVTILVVAIPVSLFLMFLPTSKAKAAQKTPVTIEKPKSPINNVKTVTPEPKPVLKTTKKVVKTPEIKEQIINIKPKIVPSETEIFFAFQPIKGAQKYLVSWNEVSSTTFHLKVIDKTSFILRDLNPGTLYEIEISPIDQDQVLSSPIKFNVKTLGEAPVKVLGVETRTITPRIGGGVSTENKIAQKDQGVAQVPAESKKDEEKNEGGWNRFLVALAILVIAAGAAIGGYYGYEWYANRSTEEPPSDVPKSNNRW